MSRVRQAWERATTHRTGRTAEMPRQSLLSVLLVALLPFGAEAVSVSLGDDHSCALLDDGKVMCWGKNNFGQLGDGSATDRSSPVEVSGLPNAQSIALGGSHSCALLTDGKVMCWGYNSKGQLGDGTTSARIFPVQVSGITTATGIAVGSEHSCAVLADGKVMCWGSNSYDQIRGWRDRSSSRERSSVGPDSTTPVEVSVIPTAVSISTGTSHSCALLADGKVMCWGSNHHNQLGGSTEYYETSGSSTYTAYRYVVEVPGITSATAIALGTYHSCALLAEGKVKCWGSNSEGQLGETPTEQCPFGSNEWWHSYSSAYCPVEVSGITTATGISLGSYHSCAVLTDGRVMCWGKNYYRYANYDTSEYLILGDIGFKSTQSLSPLEATGISTANGIALGAYHSCAVMADDKVMCWGLNDFGKLGDGTTTNRFLRVEVSGLTPAPPTTTMVCSGTNNAGNVTASASQTDKVMCWGANDWNLFGNETTATRLLRVELSGSTQAPLSATSAPTSTTIIDTPANCSCPEDEALDVEEEATATRYSVVFSVLLVLFSSVFLI